MTQPRSPLDAAESSVHMADGLQSIGNAVETTISKVAKINNVSDEDASSGKATSTQTSNSSSSSTGNGSGNSRGYMNPRGGNSKSGSNATNSKQPRASKDALDMGKIKPSISEMIRN